MSVCLWPGKNLSLFNKTKIKSGSDSNETKIKGDF